MCDKQISKGVIYFDDFFLWWKLKNQIAYETREHFDRPQIVLIWKKRKTVKFYFTVCIFFFQSQQMEWMPVYLLFFFFAKQPSKYFCFKTQKNISISSAQHVFFLNWWKFEMCFCLLLSFMTVNSVILFLEFNRLVEHWCVNRRINRWTKYKKCMLQPIHLEEKEVDVSMKKNKSAHISIKKLW